MATREPASASWSADQAMAYDLFHQNFSALWDFLARLLRRQSDVEDILITTFRRACGEIASLPDEISARVWLFATARDLALERIEASERGLPLAFLRTAGRAVDLDMIDRSRAPAGMDLAALRDAAATVWEAAAALNPAQYSLLDLSLRQRLTDDEIAAMLAMPVDDAQGMLRRLREGVEDSISLFLVARAGRQHCSGLELALRSAGGSGLTSQTRQRVAEHVASCETCQSIRAQLPSPLAVIAAFARLRPPPESRDAVLDVILLAGEDEVAPRAWSLPLVAGGALAILAGLLLLGATVSVAAGEQEPASAPSSAGLTVMFETGDGDPVPGVTVRVRVTPDEGDAETIERTTAGSGIIDLADRGPGRYQVTILSLPPELGTASSTDLADVTVEPDEMVKLTCTFKGTE